MQTDFEIKIIMNIEMYLIKLLHNFSLLVFSPEVPFSLNGYCKRFLITGIFLSTRSSKWYSLLWPYFLAWALSMRCRLGGMLSTKMVSQRPCLTPSCLISNSNSSYMAGTRFFWIFAFVSLSLMIFLSDNPKGLEDNTVMDDIEKANEGNNTIELSKKAFTFFLS